MREPKPQTRRHARTRRKLIRPVEYTALQNIAAWIVINPSQRPPTLLNELETEIYICERYFMVHYRDTQFVRRWGYLDIYDRWGWVGDQLGMGARQVRDILYEVDKILDEYYSLSWWDRISEDEWVELCKSVLREMGREFVKTPA